METGSRALPSSPSWDPEEKGNCSFLRFLGYPLAGEPVAEQNKKGTKDSPPGPPPGEGVVRSPSPEEQDPETPGRRVSGPPLALALRRFGRGRDGLPPLSCGQLHAGGHCEGSAEAELEQSGWPQEGGGSATSRRRGCSRR